MPNKVIKSKTKIVKKPVEKKTVVVAKVKDAIIETDNKVRKNNLEVDVFDIQGKVAESFVLPKEIFGQKVNEILISQAVRVFLANQRAGTVSTKNRGEVEGSTRKIYRQKGTGRARHGSIRAPIFVKGGLAFGPRPRDFSLKFAKKMKRIALFSALSSKLLTDKIKVVSGIEKNEGKTKQAAKILKNLGFKKKVRILLVTPAPFKDYLNVYKAYRNIDGIQVAHVDVLNTYQVLDNQMIIFMKTAVEFMQKNFLAEK